MPILFIYRGEIKSYIEDKIDKHEVVVEEKPKRSTKRKSSKDANIGSVLDEYNGVVVYYDGKVRNVEGRNVTKDGYNLGLKYQCVEFVKRYYYERFGHKMPDSYGHAKELFDNTISDGGFNAKRGLTQYANPSYDKPKPEDLLVYGPASFNPFGHVAIVTSVSDNKVECISQNLGKGNGTRRTYDLIQRNGRWHINDQYIVGRLRR